MRTIAPDLLNDKRMSGCSVEQGKQPTSKVWRRRDSTRRGITERHLLVHVRSLHPGHCTQRIYDSPCKTGV